MEALRKNCGIFHTQGGGIRMKYFGLDGRCNILGSECPRVSFFSSQRKMVTACDENKETRGQTEAKMFNLPSDPYPAEIPSSCYPDFFRELYQKRPRVMKFCQFLKFLGARFKMGFKPVRKND